MPAVRNKERVGRLFAQGVQGATNAYKEGVQNPRRDWQSATLEAEEAWTTGIQQAAAERRFGRGVSQTSTQEWKQAAATKGARNFGPGAAQAAEKYQRAVMPYLNIIESIPKQPKVPGDVRGNIERNLIPIAEALHQAARGS